MDVARTEPVPYRCQNCPSRSLYRSLTYRSHQRSQLWLKHRQRLQCRSPRTCQVSFRHRCVSNGTDCPRTRRQRLLLAAIIPKDSTDQTTAMVALSLTGLPTKSVFYVRTKDVGGNQVSLGSGRTDINGSAVAVMLRSSPTTTAGGAPTLSVARTRTAGSVEF